MINLIRKYIRPLDASSLDAYAKTNMLVGIGILVFLSVSLLLWFLYSGKLFRDSQDSESMFFDLTTPVAVDSDHLDVSDCRLQPYAIRVHIGSALKVKNDSYLPVDIVTNFESPIVNRIDGRTIKDIEFSFANGAGRYRYDCFTSVNNYKSVSGIFEVIE